MTDPNGPKFDTTEPPLEGGKYVDGEQVEKLGLEPGVTDA